MFQFLCSSPGLAMEADGKVEVYADDIEEAMFEGSCPATPKSSVPSTPSYKDAETGRPMSILLYTA